MTRRLALITALVAVAVLHVEGQSYTLSPSPRQYFTDANGNPLSGGHVCTYIAGTSTPVFTYSDTSGTQNQNPIVLDGSGRAVIYLATGSNYKYVVKSCASGVCASPATCADGTDLYTQDNIGAIPSAAAAVDVTVTAGETITSANTVYLSDGSGAKTAGRWYKTDSANTYSSTTPVIGIALANITSGQAGSVRISGSVTGLSGLAIGDYYVSGTAGGITATPPANKRFVGRADSTTSLILAGNPPTLSLVGTGSGGTGLVATPTNGQLPIGNGSGYTLATLTPGAGISVTNGAGTITVAGSTVVLLKSGQGTSTAAGATNVDSIALSGLTVKDVLYVTFAVGSVAQPTGRVDLVSSTDASGIVAILSGAGAVSAGETMMGQASIVDDQGGTTTYDGFTAANGTAAGALLRTVAFAATTAWTGSWTLALRHGGVTAGGTFRYNWAVYKMAGQ
jgi:hypothetical protein